MTTHGQAWRALLADVDAEIAATQAACDAAHSAHDAEMHEHEIIGLATARNMIVTHARAAGVELED